MNELWACRCGNEWTENIAKTESQCKKCGLIALRKGGFRCLCGFGGFTQITKTGDMVCEMCGTHYGTSTAPIHRGTDFL